jgi:hypothetical protein
MASKPVLSSQHIDKEGHTTSEEKSYGLEKTVATAVPVEVAPRPPTAFQLRLRALRNWLVYGNAAGPSADGNVEKMLATTWLLRSGILVILVTSAFLLKLSIERGLLGPEGRVAMSYLSGVALLFGGLNRRMRKDYWALGQALVGIGLGMFYFSSFAMVSMHQLVPYWVGGAVMVLVTVTAGLLADRLVSLPIAMVTMFGGFATPLLLQTGRSQFMGLAAYLLLLGAGVLWLANRRNWQQLTWLAMLFTYGIYELAYIRHFTEKDFGCYQTAMALFFILYSTAVFIHSIRLKQAATDLEIIGLLGNSLLFFVMSAQAILYGMQYDRLALAPLTIGLAFFYLVHALLLQRREVPTDRSLLLMFCALSGFYLCLTFPVILTGHWLGAAWALQGLMMLWLGYKLKSPFIRGCAFVLYGLVLVRLTGYELVAYHGLSAEGDFWKSVLSRCVQFLTPIVCLGLAAKLIAVNGEPMAETAAKAEEGGGTPTDTSDRRPNLMTAIFTSVAFLFGFLFVRLELGADLRDALPFLRPAGVNLAWIFAIILSLKLLRNRVPGFWWIAFLVLGGATLIRVCYEFCMPELWNCCHPNFLWSYSLGTMINTLLLTGGIICTARLLPSGKGELGQQISLICNVLWPLLLFAHTTRELHTIITYRLPGLTGGGISVLWSLFAFAFVLNGLKKSRRILRFIGLGLFSVVVFKVFLIDMQRLDAIYRVGAFLIFGILLMGAAFIYLKFWHEKESE